MCLSPQPRVPCALPLLPLLPPLPPGDHGKCAQQHAAIHRQGTLPSRVDPSSPITAPTVDSCVPRRHATHRADQHAAGSQRGGHRRRRGDDGPVGVGQGEAEEHFKAQNTIPYPIEKAPGGGYMDAPPRPLRRHVPTSHARLTPYAVPLPPNVPRRCRSHGTGKTKNYNASTRNLPRCRPTSSRGREPRCPGAPTSAAAAASRSPSIC